MCAIDKSGIRVAQGSRPQTEGRFKYRTAAGEWQSFEDNRQALRAAEAEAARECCAISVYDGETVVATVGRPLEQARANQRAHQNTLIRDARDAVVEEIGRHIVVLARKHRECESVDEYGNEFFDADAWYQHVAYFAERVLGPRVLEPLGVCVDELAVATLIPEVESAISNWRSTALSSHGGECDQLTGFEYEQLCAKQLAVAGWQVAHVGKAGDQGCDIEAYRDERHVVIQCKNYRSPVGNDAVQQAVAAREFWRAHVAVVVSPSSFTRSAQELALRTKVILLHHDDLAHLDKAIEALT